MICPTPPPRQQRLTFAASMHHHRHHHRHHHALALAPQTLARLAAGTSRSGMLRLGSSAPGFTAFQRSSRRVAPSWSAVVKAVQPLLLSCPRPLLHREQQEPSFVGAAGPSGSRCMGNRLVCSAAMASLGEVPAGKELAVLGGGCFWCLEACYQQLKGVSKVVSGYAGGHVENPTYEQVCGKQTGHAEVVGVVFDPAVIGFEDLLDVFFAIHDPTTPNRQGNDVGPQYRSIIMFADERQRAIADKVMEQVRAEGWYDRPLVTELVPLTKFFPAEAYHQNYYNDNPRQGYCQAVVGPKVAKFRQKYLGKLISSKV